MIRPWHTWFAFSICLVVVLATMGWISVTVLRLDQAEAMAQVNAQKQEAIRLALWRMDSALAPVVTQVAGLPYFAYRPFYPAERAYTWAYNDIPPEDVLLPSPLLTRESPYVLLYFQSSGFGRIDSPQVPEGAMRELAIGQYTTAEKLDAAAARLKELRDLLGDRDLLAAVDTEEMTAVAMALPSDSNNNGLPDDDVKLAELSQDVMPQQVAQGEYQQKRNIAEQIVRGQQLQQTMDNNTTLNRIDFGNVRPVSVAESVSSDRLRPVWIDDLLLLAQRVSVGKQQYVQGCWLNWSAIDSRLCNEVSDLLPNAKLEPVTSSPTNGDSTMLTALPVRLVPGEVPLSVMPAQSPIRLSLFIGWGCVLVAAVAVGLLVAGTVSLSERRAAFVSAVTHEMRTPLTTLQMYTDMLTKGMVPSEEKRERYLNTLRREALRLGHLVENVLAYSRLERVKDAERREPVAVGTLLERMAKRLGDRAAQAEMELSVDSMDEVADECVLVDSSAVEQILFNLVDNACKYASSGDEKSIEITVAAAGQRVQVTVRDHGAGIADEDRRILFRPFRKSAHRAAVTAPGVGLGLALSRRLARQMGGELRLDDGVRGGCSFVLELPRVV